MDPLNLRPLAIAVLLLTFLSVSGATFTDTVCPILDATGSCCFLSDSDDNAPQTSCSTPDCLCLFCLHLHLTSSADVSFPPLFSDCPVPPSLPYNRAPFVRPIDYPPEYS